MDTLQYEVLRLVNHISLTTGIAAPEHIDQMLAMGCQGLYGGISELLPTETTVAIRLMGTHRQRCIEQQHPLFCPARQVARLRDGRTEVILYLLEDILQRRREHHPILHGETQSMCLSGLMIRVLSDNHHLHLVKRTQVEGIEDQFSRGVTSGLLILLPHGLCQLCEVGLVEFLAEIRLPCRFYLDIHEGAISILTGNCVISLYILLHHPRWWLRCWPGQPSRCRRAGSRSRTPSCWQSYQIRWNPCDAPDATDGPH